MFLVALKQYYLGTFLSLLFYEKLTLCSNLGRLSHSDFVQRKKSKRLDFLRHSHVSLLINMGFSALAIGNRVGHESEKITYRYAHLFPSVQDDMAQALDEEWKEGFDVCEE